MRQTRHRKELVALALSERQWRKKQQAPHTVTVTVVLPKPTIKVLDVIGFDRDGTAYKLRIIG